MMVSGLTSTPRFQSHDWRMKQVGGFTLLELLVVIAIIALLIGILVPTLSSARESGRAIVCINQIKQVVMGNHVYANDYKVFGGYRHYQWTDPITNHATYDPDRPDTSFDNRDDVRGSWHILGLLFSGILTDRKQVMCPSIQRGAYDAGGNNGDGFWEGTNPIGPSTMSTKNRGFEDSQRYLVPSNSGRHVFYGHNWCEVSIRLSAGNIPQAFFDRYNKASYIIESANYSQSIYNTYEGLNASYMPHSSRVHVGYPDGRVTAHPHEWVVSQLNSGLSIPNEFTGNWRQCTQGGYIEEDP